MKHNAIALEFPGCILAIHDGSFVYDEQGRLVALLDMGPCRTHHIDGQAVSPGVRSALECHVPGDPLPPGLRLGGALEMDGD